MKSFNPNANKVGGFSENDGTIDFYSRINCLINDDSVVLDYGAGRGSWAEDENVFRKKTRNLKGKVKKVYACDVDKAVDLNIINKSGSWFSYDDAKLGQGRDAVKKIISDNPEMCLEIENKIKEESNL